jgi:hypothetical protein
MPIYRLYLLDPRSGHIDGFEEVSSADDVGAICLVNDRTLSVPAELWLGSRKVARFDAPPQPAPRRPMPVG